MKTSIVLALMLFFCSAIVVSGQDFDMYGTYLGETDGMTVRIDVDSREPDGYVFSFISMEEESPVFVADYSESGEYVFDDDGERLQLLFEGDVCIFDNGNKKYYFKKERGEPFSHPGYYAAQVKDDVELVLNVDEVGSQYTFTFQAWETETVITAPWQSGTTFQLTSDWGDTVTLAFTPGMCLFSGDSEGRIELVKQ